MSRYEHESGTIVIPTKAWPKFRKAIIEAWNERQDKLYQIAQRLRKELPAKLKGKESWEWDDAFADACRAAGCEDREDTYRIRIAIYRERKWRAPQRKSFPKLPISKSCQLSLGEPKIVLSNEKHAVAWIVPENNHACESAREHPMWSALCRELDKIKWTRGSGGQILGNDEYNRDCGDDYEGGGGSYVTAEWGPNVKKPSPVSPPPFGGIGAPMMSPFFGRGRGYW